LKTFLTQFGPALPLTLDTPVKLHDDQKGGTTIEIAIWRAFLPKKKVILFSPTFGLTHLVYSRCTITPIPLRPPYPLSVPADHVSQIPKFPSITQPPGLPTYRPLCFDVAPHLDPARSVMTRLTTTVMPPPPRQARPEQLASTQQTERDGATERGGRSLTQSVEPDRR
jgi:hypothetical protein